MIGISEASIRELAAAESDESDETDASYGTEKSDVNAFFDEFGHQIISNDNSSDETTI